MNVVAPLFLAQKNKDIPIGDKVVRLQVVRIAPGY
jgi:hypothetical protein